MTCFSQAVITWWIKWNSSWSWSMRSPTLESLPKLLASRLSTISLHTEQSWSCKNNTLRTSVVQKEGLGNAHPVAMLDNVQLPPSGGEAQDKSNNYAQSHGDQKCRQKCPCPQWNPTQEVVWTRNLLHRQTRVSDARGVLCWGWHSHKLAPAIIGAISYYPLNMSPCLQGHCTWKMSHFFQLICTFVWNETPQWNRP